MTSSAIEIKGSAGRRSLPHGWQWKELGEVADYVNGRAFKPDEWATTGLPIIRIQNLNSSDASFNYFDGEIDDRHRVDCGDLLISWSASLDAYIWNRGPAVLNQHIFKVIVRSDLVSKDYLYFAVREAMNEIRAQIHGATMQHITKPEFERIAIPLPPLKDQQLIAEFLKEKMAAVELARAAVETQLQAARALPLAYLRAAFNGTQAQQWARTRLGNIAVLIQNGLYKSAENYGHGHPFVRMYNIQNNSWKLKLNRMALVNLEGDEKQTYGLRSGDILISRVNSYELVGKCAIVSAEAEGYVFENMLIRLRFDNSVDPLFIAQQLNTVSLRQQIQAVARKAIGQASINSTDLRNIEIAVPNLAEQEAVSKDLDARIALVEPIINALQNQISDLDKLPAALLRRELDGE